MTSRSGTRSATTLPAGSRTGASRLLLLCAAASLAASPAPAYSILSHEALVDAAWDSSFLPRLRERFPDASPDQLQRARAYAYGGCLIQDMGYYPYGNRLFTDLTHYVRAGAFVSALVAEATDLDEYAFALGAAGHYAGDGDGHAIGTNRAVPISYPALRRKFGDVVAYGEDPMAHVRVEFGFDVVQVAAGRYHSASYMDFVGFEVARPLLERAFRRTYGLEMKDLFTDLERAVGTYRRAVSRVIPELTRTAWERRQDEIRRLDPQASEANFLFRLPRSEYRRRFGTRYEEPGVLTRVVAFLARVVPKTVVRGIQFGLGLQLATLALKDYVWAEGAAGYVLAAIAFAATVALLVMVPLGDTVNEDAARAGDAAMQTTEPPIPTATPTRPA